MALTAGPNLGVLINGDLGEPHYNALLQQWRALDGLVMPRALSATTTAQPGSPANGDLYALPATPSGASWTGEGGNIARYDSINVAWEFYTPKTGWTLFVDDTDSVWRFDGTNWKFLNGSGSTGARPAVGDSWIGAEYFDTTLGHPIWSDGTNWVDATGTTA